MEAKAIYTLSQNLAHWLNRYTNKEGLEFTKMAIGIEVILINISKLVIMYLIAIILGVVVQTLFIHGAYIMIKRYSFGLHALNSTVCTIVSCLLFVAVPWFVFGIMINNVMVLTVFPFIILSMYLYAPADTKARPIIGSKRRSRLKWKAVVSALLLMVITIAIPNESVKLLLTLGAVYQVISILPLTYKILKRSEKNHEQFEKCT